MQRVEAEVLQKLIRLNTRCPTALQHIYRLAVGNTDCKAALEELEASGEDKLAAKGTRPVTDSELTRLVETRPEIRAVLLRPPVLSKVEPPVLALLASIADVRPGNRGIPVSKDGPFGYIATLAADEGGTTSGERLTHAFVLRLIDLNEKLFPLLTALRDFCGRDDYRDIVNEFDAWLDVLAAGGPPPKVGSEERKRLSRACQRALESPVDRSVLYGLPRISQIPAEFIHAFPVEQPQLVGQTDTGSGIDALMGRARHARDVLAAMLASSPELNRAVQLRLDAALDLLARRRFVKAQMLEFGWPRLLSYVRAPGGQRRLRELERAVLEPSRRRDLGERWQEFLTDERLVEFSRCPRTSVISRLRNSRILNSGVSKTW